MYKVPLKITPDENFKKDISSIRKQAEQKLLEALSRFHFRNIESNQVIKKAQQKARELKKNDVGTNNNRAQSTVQKTVERIQQTSELNLAQNKECEKYSSCLLNDSLVKRGRATRRKRALTNKKHNERKYLLSATTFNLLLAPPS